jgi:NADPH:quinone reductase-like Zn-dependent oxidoreductase
MNPKGSHHGSICPSVSKTMSQNKMSTHPRIVTVAPGAPLEVHQVDTVHPENNEVRVRVEWTASTPLDMHQAIGGLLVKHPQGLGDGIAGTVVEAGPNARYQVGDKVFGFTWRTNTEKGYQLYCTAPDNLMGLIPEGFTMQEVVTLPNNFVTAWHTITTEIGIELPWPKPEAYVPTQKDDWILIWGGSSSVGQFVIQILSWYGYRNILATASAAHHNKLQGYGVLKAFDYRSGDVTKAISDFVSAAGENKKLRFVIDCIGSQSGSVQPVSRLAQDHTVVAIMLPVIIIDAAEGVQPVYEMDVSKVADWAPGAKPIGVRTHFYPDNKFLFKELQANIMPAALVSKIVEPNEQVIVEGKTLLERAEKAMHILKTKGVSGARLVWRVAEEGEQ